MQIKVAICDDAKTDLEMIRKSVIGISDALGKKPEIFYYENGRSLLEAIHSNRGLFSLLLLDIDMPEISGIEVARNIRKWGDDIILIFISAHEQYVFESIEYTPFRYIRKNKIAEELPLAIKAAYSKIDVEKDEGLVVKTDEGEAKIKYSDVVYCEMESRRLQVYLVNGQQLSVRKTVKEFLDTACDNRFIQLYSGLIVNIQYIKEFSNFDITLDNGKHLIVSRRRMKDVKSELLKYWRTQV